MLGDFISASTPYLAFIAALAAALIGVQAIWNKAIGPALGATLLKGVSDKLERVESRLEVEFGNGVPYDSPRYVPMRKRFDEYVSSDEVRWRIHDEEAAAVRERLGVEQRAVRGRLEREQEGRV